jgi:hypothetical protein
LRDDFYAAGGTECVGGRDQGHFVLLLQRHPSTNRSILLSITTRDRRFATLPSKAEKARGSRRLVAGAGRYGGKLPAIPVN